MSTRPGIAAPAGRAVALPETPDEKASARSWWLIPAVIIVSIVAVLVGIQVVETYLPGLRSPFKPPPVVYGVTSDLCNATHGTNCVGNSFLLPTSSASGTSNTSACDIIPNLGSGEQLWLNLTNSGSNPLDGILLATTAYGTGPVTWAVTPWLIFGNSSDSRVAPWAESVPAGSASYAIPVPSTHADWCLGWWMPSGSTQVTLNSDVTLTYEASRVVG